VWFADDGTGAPDDSDEFDGPRQAGGAGPLPSGAIPRPVAWCPLRRSEITWIALTAFAQVFDRAGEGRRRGARSHIGAVLRALRPRNRDVGAAGGRGPTRADVRAATERAEGDLLSTLRFSRRRDV
jgi:hypothetical protein